MQPALSLPALDSRPVRTGRGNDFLKRDAREIPRRLRGVLLAIDGRQTVLTYIDKLDGFGDVASLIAELTALGLVELHGAGRRARSSGAGDDGFRDSAPNSSTFGDTAPPDDGFDTLEAMGDDPGEMFQTLAASTIPGGFDELVRVAQLDARKAYRPPPPKPAAPPPDINRQVEGLFNLLDAVRGERKALRERIEGLRRYRDRCQQLQRENARLSTGVQVLALTCGILVVMLVVVVLRH